MKKFGFTLVFFIFFLSEKSNSIPVYSEVFTFGYNDEMQLGRNDSLTYEKNNVTYSITWFNEIDTFWVKKPLKGRKLTHITTYSGDATFFVLDDESIYFTGYYYYSGQPASMIPTFFWQNNVTQNGNIMYFRCFGSSCLIITERERRVFVFGGFMGSKLGNGGIFQTFEFPTHLRSWAYPYYMGYKFNSVFYDMFHDLVMTTGYNSGFLLGSIDYDISFFALKPQLANNTVIKKYFKKPKFFYSTHLHVYAVGENNNILCWGYVQSLCFDKDGVIERNPKFAPIRTGSIGPNVDYNVISIYCASRVEYQIFCYFLVTYNGRNEVLSVSSQYPSGESDIFGLGREVTEDDYYLPKKMSQENIDPHDSIIALGSTLWYHASNPGGQVFFITKNGLMYTIGHQIYLCSDYYRYGHTAYYFWSSVIVEFTNRTYTYAPVRQFYGDLQHLVYLSDNDNSLNYTCYNIAPHNPSACNGHGKCLYNDTCNCTTQYYGDECQYARQCYNVMHDDYENVCSGNGLCYDEQCSCFYGYDGERCDDTYCDGITSNDGENVCSGNGLCYEYNTCMCDDMYGGVYCGEKVYRAYVNDESLKNLEVLYEMKSELLSDDMKAVFNCSRVVYNWKYLNTKICSFKFNDKSVTKLNVKLAQKFSSAYVGHNIYNISNVNNFTITHLAEKIIITPITKRDSYIILSIEPFTPNGSSLFWYFFGTSFVVGILIILCIVIVIIVTIFVILYIPRLRKQQKKIELITNVKDIHFLLREAKASNQALDVANLKINKRLFEISWNEIELIEEICRGGSGAIIFKARLRGVHIVAFKVFKVLDQKMFDAFEKEVELFSALKHINLVNFFGCCVKLPRLGICSEWCNSDTLRAYIVKTQHEHINSLSLKEKIRILIGVCCGMEFLHSKNVIHRDLKTENVFLDDELVPKIADFGLSKVVENEQIMLTRQAGTSYYMSPEVTLGNQYDNKCDVFAMGIILWELFFEFFHPYGEGIDYNIEIKVALDPNFRPHCSVSKFTGYEWYLNLMKRCYHEDPKKRPTFKEIFDELSERIENIPDNVYSIKPSLMKEEGEEKRKRKIEVICQSERVVLTEMDRLKIRNETKEKEIEMKTKEIKELENEIGKLAKELKESEKKLNESNKMKRVKLKKERKNEYIDSSDSESDEEEVIIMINEDGKEVEIKREEFEKLKDKATIVVEEK